MQRIYHPGEEVERNYDEADPRERYQHHGDVRAQQNVMQRKLYSDQKSKAYGNRMPYGEETQQYNREHRTPSREHH